MNIPLVDLKAQYLSLKKEIDEAVKKVINSSAFIMGEELKLFEEEFARFCGSKYTIGVASGTAALHLSLKALGVKVGDEVITTPQTFIATAEAISNCGAKPVFVDIDEKTYNIDPGKIEKAITKRTRAIIPVHLYGHPAAISKIMAMAKKYRLKVIEDCAQAHGAEYKGKKVGSFGDTGCFSFFPAKSLGGYGDGGMVTTNKVKLAKMIRLLRDHGRIDKYKSTVVGFGERLDNLQAAILRVKLRHLNKWINKRRQIVYLYNQFLSGPKIITPHEAKNVKTAYYVYTIRVKNRDRLREKLKSEGIATGIYYSIPLHLQPAYKFLSYRRDDFPITEKIAKSILSLPLYPELSKENVEKIAETVLKHV